MADEAYTTGRYSLGARLAMIVFGAIIIVTLIFAGRRVGAKGRQDMIATKYGMTAKNIQDLAEGLTSYYNVYNRYMPYTETPQGPILDMETWGSIDPGRTAQYITGDLTDPFTSDEEPLRYWSGDSGWTIWSMGPDGDYDLTDPKIYAAPGPQATGAINEFLYNYANGIASNGDIITIYRPVPEQ
jgi:hypothetical protein